MNEEDSPLRPSCTGNLSGSLISSERTHDGTNITSRATSFRETSIKILTETEHRRRNESEDDVRPM